MCQYQPNYQNFFHFHILSFIMISVYKKKMCWKKREKERYEKDR